MSRPPFEKKLPTINLIVTTREAGGRKHFNGFAYLADKSGNGPGKFLCDAHGTLPIIVEPKPQKGRPKKAIENITLLAHYDFVMMMAPTSSPEEARNCAMRIITSDASFAEIDPFGEKDKSRGLQKQIKKARDEIKGLYTLWITDPKAEIYRKHWFALESPPIISNGEIVIDSHGWECLIGKSASFGRIKARHLVSTKTKS